MAEPVDLHDDLGGYVLGVLTVEERVAFEGHLAACDECRRELDELAPIPALLDRAAPPVDVPPELMAQTFAAIERAAAAEPGDLVPTARGRGPRRRPGRTVELRRVVAAAAAVVVIGAGSVAVREVARPTPAAAQVVQLTAPGGGPARAVARVRATKTGGVIDMEVEGLAPPPAGSFFECWLVAAEGDGPDHPRRISVGTFDVDAAGRATVRWDFTADIAAFPRIGVTVEPADGNPVQTTDRVLAGTRLLSPVRS